MRVPLVSPDPYEASRRLVAMTELQSSLGPFDSIRVQVWYVPGEGWCHADVVIDAGTDPQPTEFMFVASGAMTTDPVWVYLAAMGQAAAGWHTPSLFPVA